MIKNKRGSLALVISVLSILAILLNSNPTFANEVSDSVDGVSVKLVAKKKHNIRKSFDPSSPILDNLVSSLQKGGSLPTANWNVKTQGAYNMQGSWGGGNYLYSNYNITGDTFYPYYFFNEGLNDIRVSIKNSANGATLHSFVLERGYSYQYFLNMNSSTSRFYFEFYSQGDFVFSGYVTHQDV